MRRNDSALHVYTKLVKNLDRFELTPNTSYQQYVHATDSNRVDPNNLLPLEFPEVSFGLDTKIRSSKANSTATVPV